jgi:hypothetical protein
MLKYLQVVWDRLSGQKAGISNNSAAWTGQPDTPLTVQGDMDALVAKNGEVDSLEDQLSQKRAEARTLASDLTDKADATELRARGIHATEPGKLQEYNISLPADAQNKPVPAKAVIKKIEDDDDGIGFKIKIQNLPYAEFFEVQRGRIPADSPFPQPIPTPPPTVLQPPYPFLRSTKKQVIVDDDVEAGVRYFYRVRGVNATGPGEWSEPVSAVQ